MLRVPTFLLATAMLSACGGSSNNNSADSTTNPPVEVDPNYSYFFKEKPVATIYSYDHVTGKQKAVSTTPTELAYSTSVDNNGLTDFGTLFIFKDGVWSFVNPQNNTPKVIAENTNITEICDSLAVTGDEAAYLYYSTRGVDKDCSLDNDNVHYRLDTNMGPESVALSLNSDLLNVDEFQNVIIGNVAKGFLIKEDVSADTLVFANLGLTSTVSLEDNVTGYIRVEEFADHDSIIIKINDNLYDVTLAQLESGNIGEAFFTGQVSNSNNNVNIYTTRNQMFYTEGNKIYQYDLAKKESTFIHELVSSYISEIEINANGLLISLGSSNGDFIHISTKDLNAIKTTNVTLMAVDQSSRMSSIVGGFTYSLENSDGTRKSYFISDTGIVETIENSEWINITSSSLDAASFPVLLSFGETENTLSKWSVTTKSNEFVYGVLSKDVSGIRTDSNDESNTILLSTLSNTEEVDGLLYTLDRNKADSLKSVNTSPGFTVAF